MKERLLKYSGYVGYVGYPLFYLFCLGLFARLCFPYERAKERVVASFNDGQRAAGGRMELQIDEMSGHWLTGLDLTGIHLLLAPTEAGKPIAKLEVDEATVHVGVGGVSFDASGFGGEASGSLEHSDKDESIDLTFDSIELGKVEPIARGFANTIREALRPLRSVEAGAEPPPVPIKAKLSGTVRLALPGGKASKATGSIALEIKEAAIGDGNPKSTGGLALPRLDVGTLTFAGEAKDGLLKITKLTAGGKDLDVQGDGRITLRDNLSDSLADLVVRFRLSDAYRGKSDVTKSLFGAPGSSAPGLLELADARVKQSKRADGFLVWAVRGVFDHLDFVPAGNGAGGGALPRFGP